MQRHRYGDGFTARCRKTHLKALGQKKNQAEKVNPPVLPNFAGYSEGLIDIQDSHYVPLSIIMISHEVLETNK